MVHQGNLRGGPASVPETSVAAGTWRPPAGCGKIHPHFRSADVDLIDQDGFRANVGIILCNATASLLVGGRIGQDAWQFPQGGMRAGESLLEAMYRELGEEVGLGPGQVEVLGVTQDWLRYRLPEQFIRRRRLPVCVGQKQRWFLLRMTCDDSRVCLDTSATPEFDRWRWVDFWDPVREVIWFKRQVYVRALDELGPLLFPAGLPARPAWWQSGWAAMADG
jgi:putative (di)nucleoside polyphosphate hydrolase